MSITFLTGDALDVLKTLPDQQFQMCCTSPPYYGLRDYGVAGQIGLEETPDAYIDRLVSVFREVRRVLRDDGTLWLNVGDSYSAAQTNNGGCSPKSTLSGGGGRYREGSKLASAYSAGETRRRFDGIKHKDLIGIPWMLAFALRADGWFLRSDVIWHKPNAMPESVSDRPGSAHEHVFLLSKEDRYFYDGAAIKEPPSQSTLDAAARAAVADREYQHDAANRMGKRSPNRMWSDPAAMARMVAGRNSRNVWSIATQPFSAKSVPGWEEDHDHYALMPARLAERCILAGTSEAGACPHCAAPWKRQRARVAVESTGAAIGGDPDRQDGGSRAKDASGAGGNVLAARWTGTSCFAPACSCPAHEPVPCTVLDPFGGAGTTGMVALRLRRQAVLIELNPKNVRLAQARIAADAPAPVKTARPSPPKVAAGAPALPLFAAMEAP